MSPAEIEQFLTQSLSDRKLSGGEKQSLADWLARHANTDQVRGVVRHTVFDIARKATTDPDADHILNWVEAVMKVVAPIQSQSTSETRKPGEGEDVALFAPGEECLRRIVSRFATARQSADVCVFTITDDRISRAILDAHKRKVRVRIITDNEKAKDLGSDIDTFEKAGIPVKVDDGPATGTSGVNGHMHHKFAIFDSMRLLNGSYNWTRGAAEANYENLVDTDDPVLVAAFAVEFERLWNKF